MQTPIFECSTHTHRRWLVEVSVWRPTKSQHGYAFQAAIMIMYWQCKGLAYHCRHAPDIYIWCVSIYLQALLLNREAP